MESPLCPATGEPAIRLVQTVTARFLADLWRHALGVDARSSFGPVRRFGLWEGPTGLYFFDPPCEGDAVFYTSFYRNRTMRRYLEDPDRSEFRIAAGEVRPGDRILDVGCGFGPFRSHVPDTDYVGLDPYFDGAGEGSTRTESLRDHLGSHAGSYDVASAFQVMEHVADPFAFIADMTAAVRPGGTVMIGVPQVGGAHTRIPNYLVNAVPHHLTWWTEESLAGLAVRAGLEPLRVVAADWSRRDAVVYRMSRLSPIRCREVHFKHAWTWHASAAFAALAAPLVNRLLPPPKPGSDPGISLLLIARRPR